MQDGTSVPVPALSPAEEQERWLHDAFKAVKQHAFYMKRALVRRPAALALAHGRGRALSAQARCPPATPRRVGCRASASSSAPFCAARRCIYCHAAPRPWLLRRTRTT